MSETVTPLPTFEEYEAAAQEYYYNLPLEHFMESAAQAKQRTIFLNGLPGLENHFDNLQVCNELAIQYRRDGQFRRVVPDSMLLLGARNIDRRCFHWELEQQTRPIMVLEYVSHSNKSKDYEQSFRIYEQDLEILYALFFDPEFIDLRIYQLVDGRYEKMKPDENGRIYIEELQMHVGVIDGWARFWFRGELLPVAQEWEQINREKDERLQAQEEQIQTQEEQIQTQEERLQTQEEQIQTQEERLQQSQQRQALQNQVLELALQAQRMDILQQLPQNPELTQLRRWLDELSSAS